ncbi:MAG: hypothetical protein D6696_14185 [Acidobacteria bacterium]|nr:MAG: hypothetical protein D6696_14185 [Acidobacteriota bacterium]
MGSERRGLPLLLAAGLAAGCATGEVRVCEGESEALLSDGTIRKQFFRLVTDPTAGGALHGTPPAGDDRPRKMILLLDYSGSMFPGYGKPRVAGCDVCRAGLRADGTATRNAGEGGQPYYYEMPRYRDLVARWLDAATPPGSRMDLEILLYNSRLWRVGRDAVRPFGEVGELSFELPVASASGEQIGDWLRPIPGNPYTLDRQAPNTTESRRALETAIEAVSDEAILWLVTDNIVDVGGGVVSAEDARRNLDFYEALKSEPRLQMVVAYPLSEAEPCSWMCGTSLFVYGFYVSRFERAPPAEIQRLGGTGEGLEASPRGLLWNRDLQALAAAHSGRAAEIKPELAGVPLRLKPIDSEVLSLDFELHAGQALKCDVRAEYGDPVPCVARLTVRNVLRHQRVESARLRLRNETLLPRKAGERRRLPWASAVCAGEVEPVRWAIAGGAEGTGEETIELGPLAPLESKVVDVLFRLPPVHVDTGRTAHLADVALTNRILLDGRLVAEIEDVRTSLYLDTEGLEGVYGAAELPQIFRGREQARIVAEYPAGAVIANNGQILGLTVLGGGLGLFLLAGLVALRFQRVQYTVRVDGRQLARLSMPRWSRRRLEIDGRVRAHLTRRWGPAYRLRPRRGYRLRKDGATWVLAAGGEGGGEEYRIDVHRGWSRASRRASEQVGGDDW